MMEMENEIDIDKVVDEIFEQPKKERKAGRPKKVCEEVTTSEVNKEVSKNEIILANAIAELSGKLRAEEMDRNKTIQYCEAKYFGFKEGIHTAIGVCIEAFKKVGK